MRNAPRIFPTRLERAERRVYLGVTLFYLALFMAMLWPVYPRFAEIEPRVLGMPFSLAYVIGAVSLSFAVLWALFTWERRRGGGTETGEPDSGSGTGPDDEPPASEGAAA